MSLKVLICLGPAPSPGQAQPALCYALGEAQAAPTRLLGVALFRWLCAEHGLPSEVVVFGYSDSPWVALHELAAVPEHTPEFAALGLREAARAGGVKPHQLDAMTQFLARYLGGVRVRAILSPEPGGDAAQFAFLAELRAQLGRDDTWHIDASRDLWAASLLSASAPVILASGAQVGGLYLSHGAGLRDGGRAPVLTLTRLGALSEWAAALGAMRQGGLVAPLSERFRRYDPLLAGALRDVNFAILTGQYARLYGAFELAAGRLRSLAAQHPHTLPGFFAAQVLEDFDAIRSRHLADWELEYARRALYSGDYARAVSLLRKAVVSAAIKRSRDRVDDAYRERTLATLMESEQRTTLYPVDPWPFLQLGALARVLAGDTAPLSQRELREIFRSDDTLRLAIERAASFAAVLVARFQRVPPH